MRWFRPIALIIIPAMLFILFRYVRNESGFGLTLSYMLLASLAYGFLAMTLNRSVITLNANRLTARHGPFPWSAGVNVPADRVVSFFVESLKKYTHYGYATFSYVIARLVGSARAEVLKTVKPLERAVAVQRALADGLRRLHAQRERREAEDTGAAGPDGI